MGLVKLSVLLNQKSIRILKGVNVMQNESEELNKILQSLLQVNCYRITKLNLGGENAW